MLVSGTGGARPGEMTLVSRARAGDEDTFGQLLEGCRAELRAHCYRMLGSVHDADDALQEALVRAWRGLSGFQGRTSVRSWLYAIATNAALNAAKQRSRRELPADFGPGGGVTGAGRPPAPRPASACRPQASKSSSASSMTTAPGPYGRHKLCESVERRDRLGL